ncbi:hypothetical protein PGTUg99_008510 [Puccinia graminis f. sp. tritici]|uniref:Uncharacterized protein n=1 Tax=Puccinia graminis f. sp. tritici TaxID=56615 RepID=A0A5B0QGE1_PUCGR|nr:hypothetical protein PGTUg99_008510 [Puccinia graminis f. sp. tritici]
MVLIKRVASLSGVSSRGSIFSFKRFHRFRKILQDMKAQLTAQETANREDAFKKVRNALEADDYWTAALEMSRFEKLHGRLNNVEMHWLVNYQNHIHEQLKNHVREAVVVSMDQARGDFRDWLNLGIPVEVVAAQSEKAHRNSVEIQTHLLGIKSWTRRAGFLSVIIKKGKQEVNPELGRLMFREAVS